MKNLILLFITFWLISCKSENLQVVHHGNLTIQINSKMQTQVLKSERVISSWNHSERINSSELKSYDFELKSGERNEFTDKIGSGMVNEYLGESVEKPGIFKKLIIKTYVGFPGIAIFSVVYYNKLVDDFVVKGWLNHNYRIQQNDKDSLFWSFQGSSTEERADWILPVAPGFQKQNYMGMNNSDYGGGIPVLDIWRRDAGIAIGHMSLTPELVSFPVSYGVNTEIAEISLQRAFNDPVILHPGDSLCAIESFVMVHEGDCFEPLSMYTQMIQAKGIEFAPIEELAYEPAWCAWGYEREFTVDEILGTLPKVKELGFKWAILDDGYQQAEGDWMVNKSKFPGGEKQMKDLVEAIHKQGLKAQIWWAPLAVDSNAALLKQYPQILLKNKDDSNQQITWWDSWYMSPMASETKAHTAETVKMLLGEWGFDGLKLDGQHLNSIPPDFNPTLQLTNADDAVKNFPMFFKDLYQTATAINPNAVIQNCPCGCCMSYFNMPYMNQAVSSDPTSSWQIRLKGKVYKALIGKTAYYGDHVELSDGGDDFASSFGIGAVLGSKFTWPKDNPKASGKFVLTPEKEVVWKKWLQLYNEKMLPKADYLGNLYDIGFDKPETHVLQKGDTLFYAFYAPQWDDEIEIRGLDKSQIYMAFDYFNGIDIGSIDGSNPKIRVSFNKFLLIEVRKK